MDGCGQVSNAYPCSHGNTADIDASLPWRCARRRVWFRSKKQTNIMCSSGSLHYCADHEKRNSILQRTYPTLCSGGSVSLWAVRQGKGAPYDTSTLT